MPVPLLACLGIAAGSSICQAFNKVVGDSSGPGIRRFQVIACNGGQNLGAVEPGHVGYFLGVDDNIPVQSNAVTADHQRRWEGPRLKSDNSLVQH